MISLTLPMPDRNLSLNGRVHWRQQRAGQAAQHQDAMLAGIGATTNAGIRVPVYPTEKVTVYIDVERKPRGQVWDTAGVVEACKGYCDGLQGIIYANDSQIRGFMVRWDARPTGRGLIHLYIRSVRESQLWPVVAWATEEMG